MCQIVVIKNNKKLSKDFLKEQHNFNSDGIGFCWYKNKKWYWKKFMDFEEFYNFYSNCEYEKAVIHFRLGTSGSKSLNNVHPFLISKIRDVDLVEGTLENDEILIVQNGVTNEIFTIAKFLLLEDLKNKDFSDTKTIAYLFKKLNIIDINEIAKRLKILDNHSKFVIISNGKIKLLGNFFEYEKNVLISNYARYICYYYTNKNNNKKRLDVSSRIERLVSEKLNKSYSLTFLRYDFNSNLFELDIEGEKLVFGLKGLKRFLRKIGVNENEIKEIIEKVKEEIKRENEKRRTEQNKNKKLFDYDYDYYYYFR